MVETTEQRKRPSVKIRSKKLHKGTRKEKRIDVLPAIGPILAVLTILISQSMNIIHLNNFPIRSVFSLVIVYGTFVGGLKAGILTSLIALMHSMYPIIFQWEYFSRTHHSWVYFIINGLLLYSSALITGNIYRRYKKQCEELAESRESYRQLVDLSPAGIFVHDGERLIFANKVGAQMMGVQYPNQIIGRSIFEVVLPEDIEEVKKILGKVARKRKVMPLREQKLIRLDGVHIDTEVTTDFFPHHGETRFLVFIRDITERKKAEALQKEVTENAKLLSEAIDYDIRITEYFTNLSHELRTPINVILSSLQLLDLNVKNNDFEKKENNISKQVVTMKQNCNRLLRLVNNLIDVNKIDCGFFEIQKQNIDIVSLVEEISLSAVTYIQSRGIEVTFDTEMEEKIIACDPIAVERMLLNLLSNALKFTKSPGKIIISIYEVGECINISIKDTGIGIDTEMQKVIFERFKQVDRSLSRNHEGSGIGLYLVKSLVELHEGSVSLKSQLGKGSEFIIELPIKTLVEEREIYKEQGILQDPQQRVCAEFSDIYE